MMPSKRRQWSIAVLAVCAIAASASMMLDMRERKWTAIPVVPYDDPTTDHWLYQSLSAVSRRGDSLGIWGWAAHIWVYSGLIPATRESSSEFALLDWGTDHYYRRRYLDTLVAKPPEFFVEAVGPMQFLFTDRKEKGLRSLPALQQFVATQYEPLFDDGETGLYARRTDGLSCCSATGSQEWHNERGKAATRRSLPGVADLNGLPWSSLDAVPDARAARWTMRLHSERAFHRVIVPVVLATADAGSRVDIRISSGISAGDEGSDCRDVMLGTAPMTIAMCVLSMSPASDATLSVSNLQGDPVGSVSVGSPLLVHSPRSEGQ